MKFESEQLTKIKTKQTFENDAYKPKGCSVTHFTNDFPIVIQIRWKIGHYDGKALSFNPGLQYPHLHGPVHTPDNNSWDTPPV